MFEIIIGVISGIVSGTGMGGGTILIFLLTYLCNIEQHIAQATNLIFFIPTSIIAIIVNAKNRNINVKLGIIISLYGILGAIIGANLEDQIFGSVFQDMLNSVMKYAILILIGMFLWGLLVAGVMFVVSKYLFHENITFIQTYAVIAVKTLAGVILFTAYVIFFIAMMYVAKIFNSDIGAIIMLIVMLLVIPIVMFTNFIFLYGYFEVLEREPSVKLYEILVMHIVLFIISLIVGKILGYFIQQAISDSLSGIGGWLLSGLFS